MSLYVATDLSCWEPTSDNLTQIGEARDITVDQRVYRRLDPDYYAFLRRRMEQAKAKLPPETFRALADRFNTIHARALSSFGQEALLSALRTLDLRRYHPPTTGVPVVVPAAHAQVPGHQALAGYVCGDARHVSSEPAVAADDAGVTVGMPVYSMIGEWFGFITVIHAADEWFPGGWVEVSTGDGRIGQADLRFLTDQSGHRLAPLVFTPAEQHAMSLPDDMSDEDIIPEHRYPETGDWPFTQPVSFEAVLAVDQIRDEAIRLGWSIPALYQNRGRFHFPYGQDYGLVCYLHAGDRITEVTPTAIAMLPAGRDEEPLRFYRVSTTPEV